MLGQHHFLVLFTTVFLSRKRQLAELAWYLGDVMSWDGLILQAWLRYGTIIMVMEGMAKRWNWAMFVFFSDQFVLAQLRVVKVSQSTI